MKMVCGENVETDLDANVQGDSIELVATQRILAQV